MSKKIKTRCPLNRAHHTKELNLSSLKVGGHINFQYLKKRYIAIAIYMLFNFLNLVLSTQALNAQAITKEQNPTYRKGNIEGNISNNKIKTMPFSLNKQYKDEISEDPFLQLDVKQNTDRPKTGLLSIGVKGFLQIAGNMYLGTEGEFALTEQLLAGGGIFADFRLSPYFSIEIDLFYQAKAITLDNRKSQLFYFSAIPYLKIFPAAEVFFIGFGPSIQIHTLSKIGIDSPLPITPLTLVYGITAGVGIQINSYPLYFTLEYRADIGIGSMLSVEDIIQADIKGYPLVFRDMQIIFGIGYYIF